MSRFLDSFLLTGGAMDEGSIFTFLGSTYYYSKTFHLLLCVIVCVDLLFH